ncbi:MAG: type II toxin-antitoxin system VapC family toxin [Acidimicrobiales bacterium]
MIAYFDTSAVIPLLIEEAGSETAGRLWDEADRLTSVRLVYPEARAALAQAQRMARLSSGQLREAVGGFELLFSQLDVIEVSEALASRAGELAESEALRGYDAVHLAALGALGQTDVVLVSGDDQLCEAGRRQGFRVAELS